MNALTRWDPSKEMDILQNRLAKFFGLAPANTINGGRELMTLAEWAPSVDISEDDKEWLIKAEIPEVKKEDVKVTVENGVLAMPRWMPRRSRSRLTEAMCCSVAMCAVFTNGRKPNGPLGRLKV
jgi:hypothetical protein